MNYRFFPPRRQQRDATHLLFLCVMLSILSIDTFATEISYDDEFGDRVFSEVASGKGCRYDFEPFPTIRAHESRDGSRKDWTESDSHEPSILNYWIQWTFPGFELKTFSHFSYYGVSTWLHTLVLSAPTKLPGDAAFGQSVPDFADALGISEQTVRQNNFRLDGGYIDVKIGDDDRIQTISIRCVAD